MALLSSASISADSSCSARSTDEGMPRTCSITCDSGKQAVCEEGVAGSAPQCRCVDEASEAEPGEENREKNREERISELA
jgi:hypothetical protein